MVDLKHELDRKLLDEFSRKVLEGSMLVLRDKNNPIRINLFSAGIRELFGHTLHTLASDEEVKSCIWFQQEDKDDKPTRRQRAIYAIQGGLADSFVNNELLIDTNEIHDRVLESMKKLNRYTHVRPASIIEDEEEIKIIAQNVLSALEEFLDSIEFCRGELIHAVEMQINSAVLDKFLFEAIEELDILSNRTMIEGCEVEKIEITKIGPRLISYEVSGTVYTELGWGSGDDVANLSESFPFNGMLAAPVHEPNAFLKEQTDVSVDTTSWYM